MKLNDRNYRNNLYNCKRIFRLRKRILILYNRNLRNKLNNIRNYLKSLKIELFIDNN